ncbi:MAG: DUF4114 domain-containing protein [Verrucomicrobiota bacterium]
MKKYIKPTINLSCVVILALAATVRAEDSKENNKASENISQSKDENINQSKEDNSSGGTAASVQSKADPYGLKLAGQVMQRGSDASSKDFLASVLPSAATFIKSALPEQKNNTMSKAFEIDPSKLVLSAQTSVRAYFVSEGAGYHNSIGVDVTTPGNDPKSAAGEISSKTSELIFPDASSSEGAFASGNYGTRTTSEPVLPGDFVNLGTFNKGTKLDFFLLANGASQAGSSVFSAIESLNGDGFKQHVAAFTPKLFAVPQLNSPYIFLAFEDLWGGGDKDINDTIIAINVGAATVKSLLATPEPGMWLTLGSFLLLAIWAKRRMDCKVPVVA